MTPYDSAEPIRTSHPGTELPPTATFADALAEYEKRFVTIEPALTQEEQTAELQKRDQYLAFSTAEHGEDVQGPNIRMVFSVQQMAAFDRMRAVEAGLMQFNSVRDAKRLNAHALDMLGELLVTCGLNLKQEAMREKARELQAVTQAWRDAGCPGLDPTAKEKAKPKLVSAESAMQTLLKGLGGL